LKALAGTDQPCRILPDEPLPELASPNAPTWLHREAKREWRRIVPELEALGLLTNLDRSALAGYCQSYARWYEAEVAIRRDGMIMTTATGYQQQTPAVGIARQALSDMRAFASEFGLSPAARTRISVKPAEGAKDATEDFLFGGRKLSVASREAARKAGASGV
jgi:P27 family predicted phage terminase small subunit